MKGTKQSVVDDPELLRHKQNTSIVSNVEYWGLKGKQADQESKRGLLDKGEGMKEEVFTMRLKQNGRHFADNIFNCIFLNEKCCILIKNLQKIVPKGSV